MTLTRTLLAAAISSLLLSAPATAADKIVKVLGIEVDGETEENYREKMAEAYEAMHPGVDIQLEYIENEAYKTKLPTLLQSGARPDVFFSWGGGVYYEQHKAGILADISGRMGEECKSNHSAAGIGAFSQDGQINGLPMYAAEVVLWYNKALAAEAGVDPQSIRTWQDFLDQVEQAKKAGVTPIVVGGKDKWPLHFYYSLLAVRMVGAEGIAMAAQGENDGFANESFVRVGEEFKRLVDLEPFQSGFMDAGYDKAAGLFGDGKGLFQLMGNWDYNASRDSSTSGEGLGDDNTGLVRFPMVEGGLGDPKATFGGINGWLVSEGASDEAIDFLCFMTNTENQLEGGRLGLWIPVAKGSSAGIENPFFQQVSVDLAESPFHQLFLDQALGASVGATVNDVSADIATGSISPEEAAAQIEEARMFQ